MNKRKYNYKTRGNFELLRYCASSFAKCWLAMNENGSWIILARKPKYYPTVGLWSTSKVEYQDSGLLKLTDCYKCYFSKLPKRRSGFAEHSLIRINGKGLAWFNDNPDYVVSEWSGYYD